MWVKSTIAMIRTARPAARGADHLCLQEYDDGTYQSWFSSPASHYPIGPVHTSPAVARREFDKAAASVFRNHSRHSVFRYDANEIRAYRRALYA